MYFCLFFFPCWRVDESYHVVSTCIFGFHHPRSLSLQALQVWLPKCRTLHGVLLRQHGTTRIINRVSEVGSLWPWHLWFFWRIRVTLLKLSWQLGGPVCYFLSEHDQPPHHFALDFAWILQVISNIPILQLKTLRLATRCPRLRMMMDKNLGNKNQLWWLKNMGIHVDFWWVFST